MRAKWHGDSVPSIMVTVECDCGRECTVPDTVTRVWCTVCTNMKADKEEVAA